MPDSGLGRNYIARRTKQFEHNNSLHHLFALVLFFLYSFCSFGDTSVITLVKTTVWCVLFLSDYTKSSSMN